MFFETTRAALNNALLDLGRRLGVQALHKTPEAAALVLGLVDSTGPHGRVLESGDNDFGHGESAVAVYRNAAAAPRR